MTKFKDELPSMMDGHTGTDEISKIFADKYETLYNTVSYDAMTERSKRHNVTRSVNVVRVI